MRSSNPALPANLFIEARAFTDRSQVMTMEGTVIKTALLLLLTMLSAGWTWMKFYQTGGHTTSVSALVMTGAIGGLVLALATAFKKDWASVTAPLYALFEGLFIGGLSAILEASFPGIVIQAAGLTFGTLFAMLMVYQSGLIRVTESFKMGVAAATGGIFIVYLATFVLSFFGVHPSFMYSNSLLSIGISLFVVIVAALNFVIDFDFISQGARTGAPKYMEWYGAFALIVTLVWLYVEFLRLLAKLRER